MTSRKYTIGELGKVVTGKTPSTGKPEYWSGDYPFITIPDLSDLPYVEYSSRTLSESGAAAIKSQLLPGNSVLMSCIATIGKCGITTKPSFTNQQINAVIPNDKVNPLFLLYLFRNLGAEMTKYGSGGTVYSNISKSLFESIEVEIPESLNTQLAIANVLASLDAKIAINKSLSKTLEEIAQTIFKSWFIDFDPVKAKMAGEKPAGMDAATAVLFPDSMEESEIGLIPSGWNVKPAADLFEVGIGRTPPRKEPQWFCNGTEGIPWVSIRDMGTFETYSHGTNEGLTQAAVDKFKVPVVPENTVLMSFKLTVGKLCISDTDLVTNEAIAHFKISQNSPLNTFYTYLSLSNLDMGSLDSTSSIGTATNSGVIKQIRFLVPPQELLGNFHNKVSPFFSQLKILRKQTTNLVLLRDALLPRLISGELQIPNEMLAS